MCNYTFEDYKKAIKAKFEEEINGGYSNNLNSPTSANLRNLSMKRFSSNSNKDDLDIFASFFNFPFDREKKNLIRQDDLSKFKKVKRFFLGLTEEPTEITVHFAAILVDFQPRPFNKYREKGLIDYLRPPEKPKTSESFVAKYVDEDKIREGEYDKNKEINPSKTSSADNVEEEIQIKGFADIEPDLKKEEGIKDLGQVEVLTIVSQSPTINNPSRSIKEIILYYLYKLKNAAIATLLIFSLISSVIYFAFFKNDCMQWSGDHYEVVDCSSKNNVNVVIPKNDELLDFKKLKVCDTTNCFRKDGQAFVWYTKTPDGIDFFNSHGMHPEYNRPLRPVSHYIFNKYVKGKPCK